MVNKNCMDFKSCKNIYDDFAYFMTLTFLVDDLKHCGLNEFHRVSVYSVLKFILSLKDTCFTRTEKRGCIS